ncbi:CDP-alcohol phosphatidyltransferase-domain-containing protein, partial [Aspergillus karnatakaensis]|uniref:cardiolipin synthase n=1 Tax=Aspergillus karnatakaensis TaxID=1810916 RepID=UPI003CCE16BD
MAVRPIFPLALRASKRCFMPVGPSTIHSGLQLLYTKGLGPSQFRASIFTRATTSQRRPCALQVKGTQKWGPTFRLLQRGSSQKSTDTDKPQVTPATKKSPILSRIPLPTHENIYTVPNILTFSRLIAAPLVGYFLVYDYHATALALFAYAGITDLVDGYIARRYNLQTVVGTIIDPMADKLLMTISVACLAVNGSIPVWLAVIILGRDVGLAISAIYYRWISLPPPKTMARYWDFSLPSAEVKPTGISKVNTALQLLLVGSAMALPVLPGTFIEAWNLQETMTAFQ